MRKVRNLGVHSGVNDEVSMGGIAKSWRRGDCEEVLGKVCGGRCQVSVGGDEEGVGKCERVRRDVR